MDHQGPRPKAIHQHNKETTGNRGSSKQQRRRATGCRTFMMMRVCSTYPGCPKRRQQEAADNKRGREQHLHDDACVLHIARLPQVDEGRPGCADEGPRSAACITEFRVRSGFRTVQAVLIRTPDLPPASQANSEPKMDLADCSGAWSRI